MHQRRRWRESQLWPLCCQRDRRSGMTRSDINLPLWDLCLWLPKVQRVLRDSLESGMEKPHPNGFIRWPRDFPDSSAPQGFVLTHFGSPQVKRLPPFHHSHWETIPKLLTNIFLRVHPNFFFFPVSSFHLGTLVLGNPCAPTPVSLGSRVFWDVWMSM